MKKAPNICSNYWSMRRWRCLSINNRRHGRWHSAWVLRQHQCCWSRQWILEAFVRRCAIKVVASETSFERQVLKKKRGAAVVLRLKRLKWGTKSFQLWAHGSTMVQVQNSQLGTRDHCCFFFLRHNIPKYWSHQCRTVSGWRMCGYSSRPGTTGWKCWSPIVWAKDICHLQCRMDLGRLVGFSWKTSICGLKWYKPRIQQKICQYLHLRSLFERLP